MGRLRIFFALLAVLGLMPISNPLKQLSEQKFRLISIVAVWTLFQAFYPLVVYFDVLISFANIPYLRLLTLTQRLTWFAMVPVQAICNTTVRLVGLGYCKKTLELILTLKKQLPPRIKAVQKQLQAKRKRNTRIFVLACILQVAAHLVKDLLVGFRDLSNISKLPLYTLPEIGWIRNGLVAFSMLSVAVSVKYSLCFVVIVGVVLLDAQEKLFQLLYESCSSDSRGESLINIEVKGIGVMQVKSDKLNQVRGDLVTQVKSNTINHATEAYLQDDGDKQAGGQALRKEIFNIFTVLKGLFRDYEVIAGWYAFVVIFMGSIQIVVALAYTTLKWKSFIDGLLEVAMGASPILVISFFAEHFKSVVRLTKLGLWS